MISLRPSDLIIEEYENKEGNTVEVVNIRGALRHDLTFIEEMRNAGVKKYVGYEEEDEEEEEE